MTLTPCEFTFEELDALPPKDALCLFVPSDVRPLRGVFGWMDWRMCGALSSLLLSGFFEGTWGEQMLVPTAHRTVFSRLFLMGAGPQQTSSHEGWQALFERAAIALSRAHMSSVALELPPNAWWPTGSRESFSAAFLSKFSGTHVLMLMERPPKPPSKL